MKSTSGQHYVALDHVRALAALIVFFWHFLHFKNGFPVPFSQAPTIFPLAILDEGHVGVALFMTLSGYLFAKLLNNKKIIYRYFLWNRGLRLLPLLLFVIFTKIIFTLFLSSTPNAEIKDQLIAAAKGLIYPTLPNGGWSITVELHFYIILPLLLILARKSPWHIGIVILIALCFRYFLHRQYGEVQSIAYFTILGRIDQFAFGILIYHLRMKISHKAMATIAAAFFIFYWWFDYQGGFMKSPGYPSTTPLWIVMSTVEGAFFSLFISWYDQKIPIPQGIFSNIFAKIGEYSYSIYLLHMFFVFDAAKFIHERIIDISNFYTALPWAFFCFLLMSSLASISYHAIELPFMKWRKPYIQKELANV